MNFYGYTYFLSLFRIDLYCVRMSFETASVIVKATAWPHVDYSLHFKIVVLELSAVMTSGQQTKNN